VNASTNGKRFRQGGKQFSPTDAVKDEVAAHWVPCSEGRGSTAAQTSLPGAGGKVVESQQSVVSYFQLMHPLLPRYAIQNAYLSCKMWN